MSERSFVSPSNLPKIESRPTNVRSLLYMSIMYHLAFVIPLAVHHTFPSEYLATSDVHMNLTNTQSFSRSAEEAVCLWHRLHTVNYN